MKNLYKQKREQGFTIIEVMIVLAIAAVILLIVFLAVPALQRNSRNTQRNNDAAQVATAITTCLANHNNDITQCESDGPNNVAIDVTKLGQLTTDGTYDSASPPTATGSTSTWAWAFGQQCANDNSYSSANASKASFAVRYQLDSTTATKIQRCISS